jgi:hypothetical protein
MVPLVEVVILDPHPVGVRSAAVQDPFVIGAPLTITVQRRAARSHEGITAAMAGLGGGIGAKTGTAEVGSQTKSNSWFRGYRGDVAAAAVTQEGGHGGDAGRPDCGGGSPLAGAEERPHICGP